MFLLALWFFWTVLSESIHHSVKSFLLSPSFDFFFIVLFILLQPELEFKKSHTLKNRIAVLVDDTKSMSIKTFPSEQSRADFVRQAFETNQVYLRVLSQYFSARLLLDFRSDRTDSLHLDGRTLQS